MQTTAAPVLIGLLFDFPQHDSGASFEEAVRLGLDEGGGARPPDPPALCARLNHHAVEDGQRGRRQTVLVANGRW